MARKKTIVAGIEQEEIVDEVKRDEVVEVPKADVNAELLNIIKSLQSEIETLKSDRNRIVVVEQKNDDDVNRWITLIHLEDRMPGLTTTVRTSTRQIDFTHFGQTAMVRFVEFEEILSRHRDMFYHYCCLGLTSKDDDIAQKYGITVSDNLPINATILAKLHMISEEEMKELYNKLSRPLKTLLLKKWIEGYFEVDPETNKYPRNPAFANRSKIVTLNELSDGGLEIVLEDLKRKKE